MTARRSKAADPAPLVGAGLGRVAYEAFAERKTGEWEALEHEEAARWAATAQAVITATISRKV